LYAIFSPASRSNFLGSLSPSMTVRRTGRTPVFTHTQMTQRFCIYLLADRAENY
jgi:hypothetical protein